MPAITVSKMEHERHEGDWHDKPLRWQVNGPNGELQQFSTKAWALCYASCRRKSANANEATNLFLKAAK